MTTPTSQIATRSHSSSMSGTPSTILSNIFGLLDGKDAIVVRSVSKHLHSRSELLKRDQPLTLKDNATITPNALRSLLTARRDAIPDRFHRWETKQSTDNEKDQLSARPPGYASDDEEKAQLVLPTTISQMKTDELQTWIAIRSKAASRPDPTRHKIPLSSSSSSSTTTKLTGPVSVVQCTQLTPESSLWDILALSGSSSNRYWSPKTDAGHSLLPVNWGSTLPFLPDLRSLDLEDGVLLQDQDVEAILTRTKSLTDLSVDSYLLFDKRVAYIHE